jgi:hypothetical protein
LGCKVRNNEVHFPNGEIRSIIEVIMEMDRLDNYRKYLYPNVAVVGGKVEPVAGYTEGLLSSKIVCEFDHGSTLDAAEVLLDFAKRQGMLEVAPEESQSLETGKETDRA